MGLIGVGFVVIFSSIGAFVLACAGPMSKLWWPDRPRGRFNPSPTAILTIGLPLGIALVIVGGLLAH